MPILGPVAVQNPNGTFSWCRIELNDQSEIQALHLAAATGEGMMPALDEYTTRIHADFPSPLRALDSSNLSGIQPYCFVIDNKKLYRIYTGPLGGIIVVRVLASDEPKPIGGAERNRMIQLSKIDEHEKALLAPALIEIKSTLQRQFHDKKQLRVDFSTVDMPPNTRPLNTRQRTILSHSEFSQHWLELKRASSSQADYCLSLMAVLNNRDDDKETLRFLRFALRPDRINQLNAFYADDTRPVEDQPRLGDVHALMVHLLVQELGFYSLQPFGGTKPGLTPLQYDFMVGDYHAQLAQAVAYGYDDAIQSKAGLIIDALNNRDIQGDQRYLEYQLKLVSDIKDSLHEYCRGLRLPFENHIHSCVIDRLTTERGVTKKELYGELNTYQPRLIDALNTLFNQQIEQIKTNNPSKTVWHALREDMSRRLHLSTDLGPLILAQLDRLDDASQNRLPSSYWGTPAKVEAAVRALHTTLSEAQIGEDPTPYLYQSLFNKANGSLYHAFSSHRMPFFTKAGDPTRAILSMSLAYAKQRLEQLTGTSVGDSLLQEIDRLESATHYYWPWCYNSQKKLDGILDAIIHLQPNVKDISFDVLVDAIQQESELKTALNVHRFFQSASPTHTLKTIQEAIAPICHQPA